MFKELTLLVSLIAVSHGCLITNCPRGGKRGGVIPSLEAVVRECPSCGPNDLGQCFGPHICCGPSIGCYFGTPETYKCRKESLFTRPCIAGYAMCRGNAARCAADGICCSQESCSTDSSCRITEAINNRHKIDTDLSVMLSETEAENEIIQ